MEIQSITFRGSFLKKADRPKEWFPHVAFAGRSNVGKSSLLNWVFQRRMARVAKAPGKTRALNFFLVNGNAYFVDLPGYGYAKVARHLREQWGQELGIYLKGEERLAGVLSLVDIRHGPTALDLELQSFLTALGLDRLVVLTKADKVGRGKRRQMQNQVQKTLGLSRPPLVTSVESGEGRRELLDAVGDLVDRWRKKDFDSDQ
ncbi:MAG: ribosome biogenesis GTP-binding protein YihA/YsxC [Thermoanaerobaculales bacterium]|nr:ribosome biogenesis GTP-binding protein YihA/YsxC [Thermoanaerobaculales bacterium]